MKISTKVFIVLCIGALGYIFYRAEFQTVHVQSAALSTERAAPLDTLYQIQSESEASQEARIAIDINAQDYNEEIDNEFYIDESKECIELKKSNPQLLSYYKDIEETYGVGDLQLVEGNEYGSISQDILLNLAQSGDTKAQFILGIEYVWQGGAGIDYFDLSERTEEQWDAIYQHKLDEALVKKGQDLLFESALNGRFLVLIEVLIGQRFIVNKKYRSILETQQTDISEYQDDYLEYLAIVNLINYTFADSAESLLAQGYYSMAIAHQQIADIFPEIHIDINTPENKKRIEQLSKQYKDKWIQERQNKGYLNTQFEIPEFMIPFLKALKEKCNFI